MPKIAHIEAQHDAPSAERSSDKLTKTARDMSERGADAARESLQLARTAADAAAEQQETARRSIEDTAEFGRSFLELFAEQTRHNMQVATAFGQAVNWGTIFEAQRNFIGGSFGRMNQLNERYREIVRAGMKSTAFPSRS